MKKEYNYMTLQEFFDYKGDKSIYDIKFTDADEEFTAGIYDRGRDKTIWYDDGGTTVPTQDCDTIDKLKARMKIYTDGYYICMRCGKIVKQGQHNEYERFFAGIYCKDCWTKKDAEERDWAYSD